MPCDLSAESSLLLGDAFIYETEDTPWHVGVSCLACSWLPTVSMPVESIKGLLLFSFCFLLLTVHMGDRAQILGHMKSSIMCERTWARVILLL